MKNFTVFESMIIGFLVGVVVASYLVFLKGTGFIVSTILSWVSLTPLINKIDTNISESLILSFLCTVLVYIIYGILIGLIAKKSNKVAMSTLVIFALVFAAGFFEQKNTAVFVLQEETNIASSVIATDKSLKKYFGMEAFGDLDLDGIDDVAFIIPREDDKEGQIYYMTASIRENNGYSGTNLIFLGYNLKPEKINIKNNIIILDYIEESQEATTTKSFYAKFEDGRLKVTDLVTSVESI